MLSRTLRNVTSKNQRQVQRSYSVVTSPTVFSDSPHIFPANSETHRVKSVKESQALKAHGEQTRRTNERLIVKYPNELRGDLIRNDVITQRCVADQYEPITIAVTGAGGAICYSLLTRIASGALFPAHPIKLQLLELPQALGVLSGVEMELRDCAFPNLVDIITTDKPEVAFAGADYVFLIGSQPRTKGMERADLLMKNAEIFKVQGKALNSVAKGKDTRVLVVGNPANTNALIASRNCPNIPAENFAAMTQLDHNRGVGQLAQRLGVNPSDIEKFIVWGNHSATQFPDISHATIFGESVSEVINNQKWVEETFIPTVQQRGAAIINARGASSAASAASAAIDNVRLWHEGCEGWNSVSVASKGEYGIDAGLFFSYPIQYNGMSQKKWSVVEGLSISEFAAEKIAITHNELKSERDAVSKLLPS